MKKLYRKNCPLCKGSDFKFTFYDWQNNQFVECVNCSLIIQNPYLEMEYKEDYWQQSLDPDGKKRNMLLERSPKLKNWYGRIPSFINRQSSGRLLDVGCGPGFLLSAISNKHEKYGLEISDVCVEYIKDNYQEINICKDLLDKNTFPREYFDIVVLYHVIEHLVDPLEFMQMIKTIMKKNGIVIIGLPNVSSFCAKRFKGNFRLLGKEHLTMFSEKTVQLLLNKIGYRVIKKETPFFTTDYFTIKNLIRLFDKGKISPPFYGNIMTTYARKMEA